MSKIINGGLDQYGVAPFEQQQFGTAGVEGVKNECISTSSLLSWSKTEVLVLVLILAIQVLTTPRQKVTEIRHNSL